MNKRKFSIFISSTYEDLKEERQELIRVALDNGFIPVGMEQFYAYPASQWEVITKMIDECDFYLLVIGGRYGSIDKSTGKSYTEKEYDYAKSKGLRILVFIRNPEYITTDKMDSDEDKYKKQDMLDQFRKKVKNDGNTVCFFDDIGNLKYVTSISLKNSVNSAESDAGWVRYKDIAKFINEKNSVAVLYNEQQLRILENMKNMLSDFGERIREIENNQMNWDEKPIATIEETKEYLGITDDIKSKDSESPHKPRGIFDYSPLKPAACVMLYFASIDDSRIIISSTLSGKTYQAGKNPLNVSNEARELAKWEAAKDSLVEAEYIKQISFEKTYSIFQLTELGFVFSDRFKEDDRFDARKAPHEILEALV